MKIILRGILVALLIAVTCITVGCSFVVEPNPSESSKETELKVTGIDETENDNNQSESTIEKKTEKAIDDNNGKAQSSESSKEIETKVTEIDESEKNEQLEKKIQQAEVENIKVEETDNIELIIEPNRIIKDNIMNKENLFGMWESSPGDSEGYSQLLIYNMDNNSFDFQLYNFQYIEVNGEEDMNQYGFSGTAYFLDEDIAEFKIEENILVDFYSSVYGNFEFIDSTIQISFKYESNNRLHTIALNQVNNEDIISKRAELPFYYRELRIMGEPIYDISLINADELFGEPLNTELVERYENEFAEVRTYNGYEIRFLTPTEYSSSSNMVAITITKPGISIVRGIQVGDDIRDVVNKFKNDNREFTKKHEQFYLPLYGKVQHVQAFGKVQYENGKPTAVWFSIGHYLVFEINDNLKVSAIRFYS